MNWLSPDTGQRWIDVECGNGAFREQILELCAPLEVQGLDSSNAQIEFAKKRPKSELGVFQTGNAMDLPFQSDRFDIAVMALILFFVPDPAKGVTEMKRVVRPVGSISAYVWDIYGGRLPNEPYHKELRAMDIEYLLPPSAEVSKIRCTWGCVDYCRVIKD